MPLFAFFFVKVVINLSILNHLFIKKYGKRGPFDKSFQVQIKFDCMHRQSWAWYAFFCAVKINFFSFCVPFLYL